MSSPIDNLPQPVGSPLIPLIFIVTFICAAAATKIMTRTVIAPINDLNLDNPLANNTYAELSPPLLRMDRQNSPVKKTSGISPIAGTRYTPGRWRRPFQAGQAPES